MPLTHDSPSPQGQLSIVPMHPSGKSLPQLPSVGQPGVLQRLFTQQSSPLHEPQSMLVPHKEMLPQAPSGHSGSSVQQYPS
jgi:hypothetical protein